MARFAIIDAGRVTNIVESETDYAQAQGWVAAETAAIGDLYDGTTFTKPAPAPEPVPQSVSPRQIRQALTRAGLRTQVEAAIAAGDQDVKDWYEFATAFERSHPMVAGLAAGLGVTGQQLDDLWILAASL